MSKDIEYLSIKVRQRKGQLKKYHWIARDVRGVIVCESRGFSSTSSARHNASVVCQSIKRGLNYAGLY